MEVHEQGRLLGEGTVPAGDGGFIKAGDPGRRIQQIHILSRQRKVIKVQHLMEHTLEMRNTRILQNSAEFPRNLGYKGMFYPCFITSF